MRYRLISNGKPLKGKSKQLDIEKIKQITGLAEEKIQQALLSGRRVKLTSSRDREKLTALYRDLREAGLDVEIIEAAEDRERARPQAGDESHFAVVGDSAATMHPAFPWRRLAVGALVMILLVLGGALGYGWHWLKRPPPQEVVGAENALFDGGLVAIGMIDVEKLVAFDSYWFGDLDPNALPLNKRQRKLLEALFYGPALLRDNLRQVLISLSLPRQKKHGLQVVLLSGRFETETLLAALKSDYELERIADDRWVVSKKAQQPNGALCKADEVAEAEALYLRASPSWVMFSNDRTHGDKVWQRLQSGARAKQDVASWRDYRAGRLLSFMALAPADAGKAFGGMSGRMAYGAAAKAPQVSAVGAAVDFDPLQGGVLANLHIQSADTAWNRETASAIRRQLVEMGQDSRSFSPALAGLFSRLSVVSHTEALDIDLRLDSEIAGELEQIVQEGMQSLFSLDVSDGSGKRPGERIDEHPQHYADINLTELPPYKNQYQAEPPLFSNGPFAVDFKSIKPVDAGVLEVWLEGLVGLPDNKDGRFNKIGKLSMSVTSVQDAEGEEVLRDEHCLDWSETNGKSPNHEAATSTNHQQGHGWVWKHVRLDPGVGAEQIHRVRGTLSFSLPKAVKRFEVPLRAGESVEYAGVRFYLSRVKDDSISYQLSGKSERLLEVRGLNKDHRVLRQGWLLSDTDSQRFTQGYEGEVKTLEVYITEGYFQRKSDFELKDIFRSSETSEEDAQPAWFAPRRIAAKDWQAYAALDLDKLTIDPKKDWQIWDQNITPIAEQSWDAMKMFITHTPKRWGNNPMAHIYFPQLPELPGVLSGFSYRIDEPAVEDGGGLYYHKPSYWYNAKSAEVVVKHSLAGRPVALNSIPLTTGLAENQKLNRLKGEITIRLPQETRTSRLQLRKLWEARTVDGITLSIQEVSRGTPPGYELRVEGEIDKLVNLHGLTAEGKRVIAAGVNFQDAGYWTMRLPFGKKIEAVELVTAAKQKVLHYPFDLKPTYPAAAP